MHTQVRLFTGNAHPALASVIGGLVKNPVIAVPTSVGYGASFHGLSALLTMINSCANGIVTVNIDNGLAHLDKLSDEASQALMIELSRYAEVVEAASLTLEPHTIAQYLRELATAFHTAYHAQPVLVDDGDERDARLALSTATAHTVQRTWRSLR